MDSGATIHVTNDLSQLLDYAESQSNESVTTANGSASIHGWGTWELMLDANGATHMLKLPCSAYCPDFVVSLVSAYSLKEIGVVWRTDNENIFLNENPPSLTPKIIGKTISHNRHFIIKRSNPHTAHDTTQAAYPTLSRERRPPQVQSGWLWHRRLGHAGPEAISHLPFTVENAKLRTLNNRMQCVWSCKDDCCQLKKSSTTGQIDTSSIQKAEHRLDGLSTFFRRLQPSAVDYV